MSIIKAVLTMSTQVLYYKMSEELENNLEYNELTAIEKKIKSALADYCPFVSLDLDEYTFFKFHIKGDGSTSLSRRRILESFTWLQVHIGKNHPELTLQEDDGNE